jgi:hypothetical protein
MGCQSKGFRVKGFPQITLICADNIFSFCENLRNLLENCFPEIRSKYNQKNIKKANEASI